MNSTRIKKLILCLLGDFLGKFEPVRSFIYYSNVIFWKNKCGSEIFALLVCKMAIFACTTSSFTIQLFATLEENKWPAFVSSS